MKSNYIKSTSFFLILLLSFTVFIFPVGAVGVAVDLKTTSPYGILGDTTTVTGETRVNGSLGSKVITGTAVVSDETNIANTAYSNAFIELAAAIESANSQAAEFRPETSDLGGQVLTPGVYEFTGATTIGSNMTLNGNGVYIFQIGGELSTAADTKINLMGGAQSCNIFWVVDVATIGAKSTLEGTLMSKSAVTLGANSTTNGRILAQTAVTANAANTTINVPTTCTPLPDSAPETPETPETPGPDPIPGPGPDPIPGPGPDPIPGPDPDPIPGPGPGPDPIPGPDPDPIPGPGPDPDPIPGPDPDPIPAPNPDPTPAPAPGSDLVAKPKPKPIPDPSPLVSVELNSEGNMIIHAKLPNGTKGTGTWVFNLGGKTYKVKGSEEITYTAVNVPVGTYKVDIQFIPDNNGEVVDIASFTVSVPTVSGGTLPETATPWYNLFLVGTVLSLLGITFWIRKRIYE